MSPALTTSRPSTTANNHGSSVPKLPRIEHPLARSVNELCRQPQLDVRGVSRDGDPSRRSNDFGTGQRPLAVELSGVDQLLPHRSTSLRGASRSSQRQLTQSLSTSLDHIPEGVPVVYGDQEKTRLPVFGNRPNTQIREENQSLVKQAVPATELAEVDELESLLKDKIQSGYYEIRKRFMDNDPSSLGNVTRDALVRILSSLLIRPISLNHLGLLLSRLGFPSDQKTITFPEFRAALRQVGSPPDQARWLDPIQRHHQHKLKLSAAQVHAQIKERVKKRFTEMLDILPQLGDANERVLRHELRTALDRMGFEIKEDEFKKLWKRYDPTETGVITVASLFQELKIFTPNRTGEIETARTDRSLLLPAQSERQRSLEMERWLKDKFRQGFNAMREAFEARDPELKGLVGFDDFIDILGQFGLSLEKAYINEFLHRCGIQLSKNGVPYREFLHRFQDRSMEGMTHKLLAPVVDPAKVSHAPKPSDSVLTALEKQLMNMFQRDYLSLMALFRKLDRHEIGSISQEEFRAAVESQFNLQMTEVQWRHFVDNLTLDPDGNVRYNDFMKLFDTAMAPSLFPEEKDVKPRDQDKQLPVDDDATQFSNATAVDNRLLLAARRTVQETHDAVQKLLETRLSEVEAMFREVDVYNSNRLTQDRMHELLKRVHVEPEITRGEIRDLWHTFFLGERQELDYHEFLRHFIYNPQTSSFPNAKLVPPKKGDSDFLQTSKRLNATRDLLMDNLRSKIEYLFEPLRVELEDMDHKGTGYIKRADFSRILRELCVHLSDYEIATLTEKFDLSKDGRVSYLEFLRPFAQKRRHIRHGNNMIGLLQHPLPEYVGESDSLASTPDDACVEQVLATMRTKFSPAEWNSLRRAFKKLDYLNTGFVDPPQFRSVLRQCTNVAVTDEQMFHLMSRLDDKVTGRLPYQQFLGEAMGSSQTGVR